MNEQGTKSSDFYVLKICLSSVVGQVRNGSKLAYSLSGP